MELTDILRKAARDDFDIFKVDLEKFKESIKNVRPDFNDVRPKLQKVDFPAMSNMNNVFNINMEVNDVHNGREMVNFLIKDKTFENAIKSMTVDRLVGGSQFAKNRYIK